MARKTLANLCYVLVGPPIFANERAHKKSLTNKTHLEGFADEFVMVGQVGPAVDAGIGPVAGGQILAKCL